VVCSQLLPQPFEEEEAAGAKDRPLGLTLVTWAKGTCSYGTFPFPPAACKLTGSPTALPKVLSEGTEVPQGEPQCALYCVPRNHMQDKVII